MGCVGLALRAGTSQRWWPEGAVYAADFVNDRYMIDDLAVSAAAAYGVTRASVKLADNRAGTWSSFGPNVPARTDKGLSLEPALEYQALNAALDGVGPGVIGSGGIRPTGWPTGTSQGLTMDIIGTGYEGPLPYIRVRISGISTGTDFQWMFDNSTIVASAGQTWTASLMVRHVAGTLTGITPSLRLAEQNGNSFLVSSDDSINISGKSAQYSVTRLLQNASSDRVRMRLRLLLDTSGQNVDTTLDLSLPFIARTAQLPSPYITGITPATRAADQLTIIKPASATHLRIAIAGAADEDRIVAGGPISAGFGNAPCLIRSVFGFS